jgi:hypothetical protein
VAEGAEISVFYLADGPDGSGLLCDIPDCFYFLSSPVYFDERIVFGGVFEVGEYLGG